MLVFGLLLFVGSSWKMMQVPIFVFVIAGCDPQFLTNNHRYALLHNDEGHA